MKCSNRLKVDAFSGWLHVPFLRSVSCKVVISAVPMRGDRNIIHLTPGNGMKERFDE